MSIAFESLGHSNANPTLRASKPTPPVSIEYDHITTSKEAASPFFRERIYPVYINGFPHGARKETFFPHILDLNNSPVARDREQGPVQYNITYAHAEGKIVATCMSMIHAAPEGGWPDSNYHAAVGIDYRSVLPEARGYGIAGAFERNARKQAGEFLKSHGRIENPGAARLFIFNESSIPPWMIVRNYDADVHEAETDPCDRITGIWGKAGFLCLLPNPEVPSYWEPGEPGENTYSFNGKIGVGETLGARTAESIITRYASFRHMDGGDPRAHEGFRQMLDQLAQVEVLKPVNHVPFLQSLRPWIHRMLNGLPNPIPDSLKERTVMDLLKEKFGRDVEFQQITAGQFLCLGRT